MHAEEFNLAAMPLPPLVVRLSGSCFVLVNERARLRPSPHHSLTTPLPPSALRCATPQSMLLNAYEWSFKACTVAGSGPQLSAKEKRCISQGVATFIDARSHIAQHMMQSANSGKE